MNETIVDFVIYFIWGLIIIFITTCVISMFVAIFASNEDNDTETSANNQENCILSFLKRKYYQEIEDSNRSYSEAKGQYGEQIVAEELSKLPESFKIINDIIIKTKSGSKQIDHIVVSEHNIFIIETKNVKGKIYGADKSNKFQQWLGGYKYEFSNPVKQALNGIEVLKAYVPQIKSASFIPIVCFVDYSAEIKIHTEYDVVHPNELRKCINRHESVDSLSSNNVDAIVEIINKANAKDKISNEEHIQNIKNRIREKYTNIKNETCPSCKSKLRIVESKYKPGRYYYKCDRCDFGFNLYD